MRLCFLLMNQYLFRLLVYKLSNHIYLDMPLQVHLLYHQLNHNKNLMHYVLQMIQFVGEKYELDLLHEGANGSRLRDDMSGAKGFYVPQIFWQYSSTKILVIEWIDGIQ